MFKNRLLALSLSASLLAISPALTYAQTAPDAITDPATVITTENDDDGFDLGWLGLIGLLGLAGLARRKDNHRVATHPTSSTTSTIR